MYLYVSYYIYIYICLGGGDIELDKLSFLLSQQFWTSPSIVEIHAHFTQEHGMMDLAPSQFISQRAQVLRLTYLPTHVYAQKMFTNTIQYLRTFCQPMSVWNSGPQINQNQTLIQFTSVELPKDGL